MFFTVTSSILIQAESFPSAFLIKSAWDDWFEFETSFHLIVFDELGERHDLGNVKIGQFDMQKGQRSALIPEQFDILDERFFSLGQGDSYYENLKNRSIPLRDQVLTGLKDVVQDLSLFDRALNERVTRISLLRSVALLSVRGQFRRLVEGGARLSRYEFSYEAAPNRGRNRIDPVVLSFEVIPESNPPTNIHVLIGRNGVGKTRILNLMTSSLLDEEELHNQFGNFTSQETQNSSELFANLISVTFSAFDEFKPLGDEKDKRSGIKYSYIGLKRLTSDTGDKVNQDPKSPEMLATEFVNSVRVCSQGSKLPRWKRSLEMLEADPIFKEIEVTSLAESFADEVFDRRTRRVFDKLSSGHKIVLLTMTRLVETVEERTLVLLDEPEAHLHPPLLSAFVRALSDLLIYRNGVAIIATHSPVVLQEVPRSCAWKLRRTGTEATAERPERETFGENAGILTREIFGLEVTQSGFHRLLQSAVEHGENFETTVAMFDGELGGEARAILRAMIVARDSEKGS
jgi:energy-coupling factor transporter ATP-binding protein EcfA2